LVVDSWRPSWLSNVLEALLAASTCQISALRGTTGRVESRCQLSTVLSTILARGQLVLSNKFRHVLCEKLLEENDHTSSQEEVNIDVPEGLFIGYRVSREEQLLCDEEEECDNRKHDEARKGCLIRLESLPSHACDQAACSQSGDGNHGDANVLLSARSGVVKGGRKRDAEEAAFNRRC
jgi:hypothetical protein